MRALDIFDAVPTLRLITSPGGPIDAFYSARGTVEPYEGEMKEHGVSAAKLLVRKVAAMAYALALARVESAPRDMARGTIGRPSASANAAAVPVVIWADADVQFLRIPNAKFLGWAAARDVAYIPFTHFTDNATNRIAQGLLGETWRVDSGVMAFGGGDNAIGFVSSALDMYEGGLLRLWRRCEALSTSAPCPGWLTRNLFMNDVYVWSLLLHAAAQVSVAKSGAGSLSGANAAGAASARLPQFLADELRAFNASQLSQASLARTSPSCSRLRHLSLSPPLPLALNVP